VICAQDVVENIAHEIAMTQHCAHRTTRVRITAGVEHIGEILGEQ
jgi:hypothetical protein